VKLERIGRADDPRLASYQNVRDPAWLREARIFLAEGRRTVGVLLRAPGFRAVSLLVAESALAGLEPELGALLGDTPVYCVPAGVMDQVSGVRFHQGCVAVGERVAAPEVEELLAGAGPLVVLERISDPDNVGGLFRSARAFAVAGVLLSPGCASPLYRKAIRTSMGATLEVPFAEFRDWPGDLGRLRQAGWRLLGLTPEGAAGDLDELALAPRVALLLGSEGAGLSSEACEQLDGRVRIPMASGIDSLNVAAAGAIALQRLFSARSG
jgi:tRNA G18 (ribose-2'-O)-methylase SpoU